MTLEESYEILENYYQNIYGMYDDNWIDYDLDVAFTKLQLEKIIQKTINEQIQNIAQKKDTLCRRMYN